MYHYSLAIIGVVFVAVLWFLLQGRITFGVEPLKYELKLHKAVTPDVLKKALESAIAELSSVHLEQQNDSAFVINKGEKPRNVCFGKDSLCFIKGVASESELEEILYELILIEGNYFLSKRKADANAKLVNAVYMYLRSEL